MRPLVPPVFVAVVLAAAGVSLGARADACNPGPKPGPSAPLASIDLSAETITASSGNASISPIDYGSEISLTIPNEAAPRSYRLSIPLASDERLTVLAGGGAAITQTFPIPEGDYPGLYPPSDYQAEEVQSSDYGIDSTPGDASGGSGTIDDNQDPSWYPNGDAVDSGARDGSDIASDASEQASRQLPEGYWVVVAAFDPPLATDANGRSVPISLSKTSSGLTLSISPSSSAAFPIEIKLGYGYNPDSYDPPASEAAGTHSLLQKASITTRSVRSKASVRASTSCPDGGRPQIVISYVTGSKFLEDMLKRWPTYCADYYVSVPPALATDRPRGGSPTRIFNRNTTELKKYPRWKASKARFWPVAEINFKEIPDHYSSYTDPISGQLDYLAIGTEFYRLMRQRGYVITRGNNKSSGMWSIDEFYGFVSSTFHDNSDRWTSYKQLMSGLSHGGAKTVVAKGVVFNGAINHAPRKVSTVPNAKAQWKILFSDTTNYKWDELAPMTKFWADEAYTKCSEVCVPRASLGEKAQNTNAYMQKFARLAFAPDAPTSDPTNVTPLRTFLETRFAPLVNGWAAVSDMTNEKGEKTNTYGTYEMAPKQILRLVSLQVYAASVWIQPKNPYAGARIGVRWTDRIEPPKWTTTNRTDLAYRIARALRSAYSPGGKPEWACDPTGQSKTRFCQPTDPNATFKKIWAIFRLWEDSVSCQPPPNDNFADAQPIAGAEGSIEGTTECATWEPGETSPNGDATRSVWYRWDPPTTDYPKAVGASDSNGDSLETNVYAGNSLVDLTRNRGCIASDSGGTTYWIQVIDRRPSGEDAPTGPFTLSWGGCYA